VDPVIRNLLVQLDQAFDRRSWHGTNLRGSLRGVSLRDAAWRPAPGRHNIWELAVHAAYWKYAVRRRLTDEGRGSFPLEGANWFERPEQATAAAWSTDLALLREQHRLLRQAVSSCDGQDLLEPASGGQTSRFDLIAGVIAHDLYHAGQIQLLKRLMRRSGR
jgi:hypothetical protein